MENPKEEEAKEPFSVFVRIRPVLSTKKQGKTIMKVIGQQNQIIQLNKPGRPTLYKSSSMTQESETDLSYMFDKVFADDQTNLEVFQSTLQPLIPQLLDGYNVSCLAYGMTGSGKTHTMLGQFGGVQEIVDSEESDDDEEARYNKLKNLGLCNLAIQNLFFQMFQREDSFVYNLRVSYLEIYNEQVRDLLADLRDFSELQEEHGGLNLKEYVVALVENLDEKLRSEKDHVDHQQAFNMYSQKNASNSQNLKMTEDPVRGVVVQNLLEIPVMDASELMYLIQLGNRRRFVANTGANRFSSRSHAILIFHVEGQEKPKDTGDIEFEAKLVRSKLQIIDLAGSERAAATENKGIRLAEGALINKSLLALGQCINILADQCQRESRSASQTQKKHNLNRGISPAVRHHSSNALAHIPGTSVERHSSHSKQEPKLFIPYRDSKLTRLLKDSLGGNTKTVMIACVNQLSTTFEETMNTIKYATKARAIKNQRQKNEIVQILYDEKRRQEQLLQEQQLLQQQLEEEQRQREEEERLRLEAEERARQEELERLAFEEAKKEAARQEAARQEAAQQELARQQAVLQEAALQEELARVEMQNEVEKQSRVKTKRISLAELEGQATTSNQVKDLMAALKQETLKREVTGIVVENEGPRPSDWFEANLNSFSSQLSTNQNQQVELQQQMLNFLLMQQQKIRDLEGAAASKKSAEEGQARELQQALEREVAENRQLRSELDQAREDCRLTKATYDSKDRQIQELQRIQIQSQGYIDQLLSQTQELRTDASKLAEEAEALRVENEQIRDELFSKDDKLDSLKNELERVKTSKNILLDQLKNLRDPTPMEHHQNDVQVNMMIQSPQNLGGVRPSLPKPDHPDRVADASMFLVKKKQEDEHSASVQKTQKKQRDPQTLKKQGSLKRYLSSQMSGLPKKKGDHMASIQTVQTEDCYATQEQATQDLQLRIKNLERAPKDDKMEPLHEAAARDGQPKPMSKTLEIGEKILKNNFNSIFQKNLMPRSNSRPAQLSRSRSGPRQSQQQQNDQSPRLPRSHTSLGLNLKSFENDALPSEGTMFMHKQSLRVNEEEQVYTSKGPVPKSTYLQTPGQSFKSSDRQLPVDDTIQRQRAIQAVQYQQQADNNIICITEQSNPRATVSGQSMDFEDDEPTSRLQAHHESVIKEDAQNKNLDILQQAIDCKKQIMRDEERGLTRGSHQKASKMSLETLQTQKDEYDHRRVFYQHQQPPQQIGELHEPLPYEQNPDMVISLSTGGDNEVFNLHEAAYDRESMAITPDPKKVEFKPGKPSGLQLTELRGQTMDQSEVARQNQIAALQASSNSHVAPLSHSLFPDVKQFSNTIATDYDSKPKEVKQLLNLNEIRNKSKEGRLGPQGSKKTALLRGMIENKGLDVYNAQLIPEEEKRSASDMKSPLERVHSQLITSVGLNKFEVENALKLKALEEDLQKSIRSKSRQQRISMTQAKPSYDMGSRSQSSQVLIQPTRQIVPHDFSRDGFKTESKQQKMTSDDGNISSDFSQTKMGFFRPCGGCGSCMNCTSGKHVIRRSVELDNKMLKLNSNRQTMNLKRSTAKKSSISRHKSNGKNRKSSNHHTPNQRFADAGLSISPRKGIASNLVSLNNFAKGSGSKTSNLRTEKSKSPPAWKQRLEQKRKERKETGPPYQEIMTLEKSVKQAKYNFGVVRHAVEPRSARAGDSSYPEHAEQIIKSPKPSQRQSQMETSGKHSSRKQWNRPQTVLMTAEQEAEEVENFRAIHRQISETYVEKAFSRSPHNRQ